MSQKKKRPNPTAETPAPRLAVSHQVAILAPLALAALIWTVFWPVKGFDFITWDDPRYVFNNPHVVTGLTLENLKWAFTTSSPYFHPLTWVSHMIDAQLFGVWPGGHHLMAVALHTLSTALLFLFLYRATGAAGRSVFVAALFAIHPMRVESVAWVSERKDILPALALMIALNAYLSYVRRPSIQRYVLVAIPFVLGMLAKPILITFPFVLLLVDIWPLGRAGASWPALRASARALIIEKLPLMALSIGIVILNLSIQVQGMSSLATLPITQRLANVVTHYSQYLGMMLWPSWLAPLHPVTLTLPPAGMLVGAIALIAGLTYFAIRALPTRPYVTTGWFWFLATLVPVIGFLQAGDQGMADRFGYTSMFFLYAAIAWGITDLAGSAPARKALPIVAVVVIAASAYSTRQYLWNWRDGITLWQYAVRAEPDNHHAHAHLADALAMARRYPEAETAYREAIRLAPDFADYHFYFGQTLAQTSRLDEAISEFELTLKRKPADAPTHDALGLALARAGRVDEAISHLQEAIKLDPRLASARANLGLAFARKGDAAAALAQYEAALQIDAANAQAHSNRAALLLAMNRVDEAVGEFREAQRLEPYSADRWINLGGGLSRKGDNDAATAAFDRALVIDPNSAEAHNGRGVVLSNQGKTAEAIVAFTKAIALRPNLPHLYSNRGRAFAVQGDVPAAIRDFEQILRIDPTNVTARQAVDALKKAK